MGHSVYCNNSFKISKISENWDRLTVQIVLKSGQSKGTVAVVQAIKEYSGAEVWLHAFLTPAARLGRFTPRIEPPLLTHLARGWAIDSRHKTLPIVPMKYEGGSKKRVASQQPNTYRQLNVTHP